MKRKNKTLKAFGRGEPFQGYLKFVLLPRVVAALQPLG